MSTNSNSFYDGNRLINMLDLDKQKPSIFMICGNRTAGKTFWCKWYMVKNFLKSGKKFMILCRFGYQLPGLSETFYKDLKEVKKELECSQMTESVVVKNSIHELFIDGIPCGYCVALNNADSVKRNSTLFVDVDTIFLDEFQSETGKYCPNEVQKFISIYTSVARGNGQHVRDVKCLLASNNVTLLNPYYYELGISARLQKDTKFLRGHGWVLEITFNESASNAIKESGIGRAFSNNDYMSYSADNIYLNDSDTFIEKVNGRKRMLAILDYQNESYGLWECGTFLYICKQYDPNFYKRYAITLGDHGLSSTLMKHNSVDYKVWKECFNRGMFRFQDLKCKELMFALLGY